MIFSARLNDRTMFSVRPYPPSLLVGRRLPPSRKIRFRVLVDPCVLCFGCIEVVPDRFVCRGLREPVFTLNHWLVLLDLFEP